MSALNHSSMSQTKFLFFLTQLFNYFVVLHQKWYLKYSSLNIFQSSECLMCYNDLEVIKSQKHGHSQDIVLVDVCWFQKLPIKECQIFATQNQPEFHVFQFYYHYSDIILKLSQHYLCGIVFLLLIFVKSEIYCL